MATPEGFEAFRRDEADLDPERDARVRHRLAQLTRRTRDQGGQSPFEDAPAPLSKRLPPVAESPPVAEPPAVVAASPAAGERPGRSRVLAVAAAVVLVLVGTAVVVRTFDDGDDDDVLSGVGDASLADLAVRAAALPDRPLEEGEYLYQRIDEGVVATVDGRVGTEEVLIDRWVAVDGTGREAVSDRVFVDAATGGAEVRAPAADVRPTDPGTLAVGDLTYEEIRALDPEAEALLIAQAMESSAEASDPIWQIQQLAEVLMVPVATSEVRAAAYQGLADLGLDPIGEVVDGNGRTGLGFELTSGGSTVVVIVDPATTLVIEVRSGPGSDTPTPDSATSWRTLLEDRITTSLD